MVYRIAQFLKDKLTWLWNTIEWGNGLLLKAFYGKRIVESVVRNVVVEGSYHYRRLGQSDAVSLSEFISCQPAGFDKFFKPFSFDEKTFKRLLGNGSYMYGEIVRKTGGIFGWWLFPNVSILADSQVNEGE